MACAKAASAVFWTLHLRTTTHVGYRGKQILLSTTACLLDVDTDSTGIVLVEMVLKKEILQRHEVRANGVPCVTVA